MSDLRRTGKVVIYQGGDLEQLGELRRTADVAEKRLLEAQERAQMQTALRIGDGEDLEPLREAVAAARRAFDEFVDVAAERATEVGVNSIGRRRFRSLRIEHPPRKVKVVVDGDPQEVTHEDDQGWNVNTETFAYALVTYRDPSDPAYRTIAAPDFPAKADLERFLDDEIDEGDFDRIWQVAMGLNGAQGVDPKALRYSATLPNFGESSE